MPFLTPNSLPEESDCRSLLIPASSEWLALFGGALTEFLYKYNWEQTTGITIDETIAKMQEIIDGFYDGCAQCELPDGGKIIRINSDTGKLEELTDGAWEPATGDYYIPPPEPREGDDPDIKCLAAKNAANVMRQLYEKLSEDWSEDLATDIALTDFIELLIALVGFAFAPIAFAIAAFMFVVFNLLYQALSYIVADLWTEDFTDRLVCILLNCATATDGVVTFDWNCLNNALVTEANGEAFDEVTLRLFTQIGYIIYFIGGTDGLNLAARTTEITDDDCDMCDLVWNRTLDFRESDWGFAAVVDPVNGGNVGSYESGVGFKTRVYPGGISQISLQTARTWTPVAHVTCIRLTVSIGEYYAPPAGIYIRTAEYEGTVFYSQSYINEAGENIYDFVADDSNGGYNFQLYDFGSLENVLVQAELWGDGEAPDIGVETFNPKPC